MNWPLIIGAVFSPTRAWAEHKLKLEQDPHLRKRFIQRWNFGFLIGSGTACVGIQLLEFFSVSPVNLLLVPTVEVFSIPIVSSLSFLCLLLWIPFSRFNEIFYAFFFDGLDRIRGLPPRIPLDAADRVLLAARSYVETMLNFALIYHLLFRIEFERSFSSMAETVYFSGVTIVTLGYGDITPRTVPTQMLAIYEVFIGFVLLIVAFSAYVGGPRRQADGVMNKDIATQIAHLLNTQNQLTVPYDAAKVLKHADRYIVKLDDQKVVGCVEVKTVQWYQCEIDHLSVHPDAKRQGLGTALLAEAEAKAKRLAARIAQCTVRVGNIESEEFFKKNGYTATTVFLNQENGNRVAVYQKVLS